MYVFRNVYTISELKDYKSYMQNEQTCDTCRPKQRLILEGKQPPPNNTFRDYSSMYSF